MITLSDIGNSMGGISYVGGIAIQYYKVKLNFNLPLFPSTSVRFHSYHAHLVVCLHVIIAHDLRGKQVLLQ